MSQFEEVCVFVLHFYAVALISTKLSVMVEDLLMEVLSTWKHASNGIQAKLLHQFFQCKKVLGSPQQWNRENSGVVTTMGHWQQWNRSPVPRVFFQMTCHVKKLMNIRDVRLGENFAATWMDSNWSQVSEKHWNHNNNGAIIVVAWTLFSQVPYS
jgi:hypothetical protein